MKTILVAVILVLVASVFFVRPDTSASFLPEKSFNSSGEIAQAMQQDDMDPPC